MKRRLTTSLLCAAVWSNGALGAIESISFVSIVDDATAIPGGPATFSTFDTFGIGVSEGNVVFVGSDEALGRGVYVSDGESVSLVADGETLVPGTTEPFSSFSFPAISGEQVVFLGTWESDFGMFLWDQANGIRQIVGSSTPFPGGTCCFANVTRPSIHDSTVFFGGRGEIGDTASRGVYAYDGVQIVTVADGTTPTPDGLGTLDFSIVGAGQVDSGNYVFVANDVLYLFSTSLSAIADFATTAPGASEEFSFFGFKDISGEAVAFRARAGSLDGVYRFAGDVSVVASTAMVAPGTSDNFTSFNATSISPRGVVFFATTDQVNGIYGEFGDGIETIVVDGDTLDGRVVDSVLSLDVGGFDGEQVAFIVRFEDNSLAIYRADLEFSPSPPVPPARQCRGKRSITLSGFRHRLRCKRS